MLELDHHPSRVVREPVRPRSLPVIGQDDRDRVRPRRARTEVPGGLRLAAPGRRALVVSMERRADRPARERVDRGPVMAALLGPAFERDQPRERLDVRVGRAAGHVVRARAERDQAVDAADRLVLVAGLVERIGEADAAALPFVLPATAEFRTVTFPTVVLTRASPPPPVPAADPLAVFPTMVLF